MENASIDSLVSALQQGNMADANDTFAGLMTDKINAALDDTKIAVAQSMGGADADVDVWPDDGNEIDDNYEDETGIEASAEEDLEPSLEVEDEDIQAVSNETDGEDF